MYTCTVVLYSQPQLKPRMTYMEIPRISGYSIRKSMVSPCMLIIEFYCVVSVTVGGPECSDEAQQLTSNTKMIILYKLNNNSVDFLENKNQSLALMVFITIMRKNKNQFHCLHVLWLKWHVLWYFDNLISNTKMN